MNQPRLKYCKCSCGSVQCSWMFTIFHNEAMVGKAKYMLESFVSGFWEEDQEASQEI